MSVGSLSVVEFVSGYMTQVLSDDAICEVTKISTTSTRKE